MPNHYHLLISPYNGPVIAEGLFDSYEESVVKFTKISRQMFGHIFEEDDAITIDKVMENSEGNTIVVGTQRLCIFWFECQECQPMNSN